jgi:hypothetical protein
MNEHIRELAKRKAWNAGGGVVSNLAVEAIAELIVKECAQLVQGVPVDTVGYHTADQKIKQHFGIE